MSAIDCALVVGGAYHDMDFARLELLKLLAERPEIRTRVFDHYPSAEDLAAVSCLITYTCDRVPDDERQKALSDFLEGGGRWLALHGTNSILKFIEGGTVTTPDLQPDFMNLLGSQFIGHPAIGSYHVEIADPDHPLVAGILPFDTVDELYLSRVCAPIKILLDCWYDGAPLGSFRQTETTPARHPVLYLRDWGKGSVLYFTLGHCRGHHDMRPLMEFWPTTDRCSWENPVFHALLRRGIGWASEAKNNQV